MPKIRRIILFELKSLLSRKSYLRIIFLVPILGFIFYFGALMINRGIAPEGVTDLFSPAQTSRNQAVVDNSGLIGLIPDHLMDKIILVETEASARDMVLGDRISDYFIISKDYLITGEVDFIQKNFNFLTTEEDTETLQQLITFNLFSDPATAIRYLDPLKVKVRYLEPQTQDDNIPSQAFWLPYTIMMMFYMLIIGASSLMLNSITSEKKNRVIEILLTSFSPIEMLVGKTIALGIAGLLQTTIWLTSGFFLLTLAGEQFALPQAYTLPRVLLAFGILFFILGYALYSCLMAGLGALVPNPKEGSQATLIVIFPLLIPLFFSSLIAAAPNHPFIVFFSLFPLTAPISMLPRMSATQVPLWQVGLSVLLMIGAIIFTTRTVARMFRAQELLSGKPFNTRDFLKAFTHSKPNP